MVFHVWHLLHHEDTEEASCDHIFQLFSLAGKQTLLFPVDATADRTHMFKGPKKKSKGGILRNLPNPWISGQSYDNQL